MAAPSTMSCPVTEVTLYEDRAQVHRAGTVGLPAGTTTVIIPGIAPVCSDRHVTTTLSGAGDARITSLRVERRRQILRGERPERFQELLDRLDQAMEERTAIADEQAAVSKELEQLGVVVQRSCEEMAQDATYGRSISGAEATALRDIDARSEALITREGELALRLQDADRRLQDIQTHQLTLPVLRDMLTEQTIARVPAEIARDYGLLPLGLTGRTLLVAGDDPKNAAALDDLKFMLGVHQVKLLLLPTSDLQAALDIWYPLKGSDHPWQADLHLTVEVERTGDFQVQLAYVVPNACWRPCHVARHGAAGVELVQEACVWQRTGEDWHGVTVWCSTARASLGTEPPVLATDELSLKPKQNNVVVETREQAIETTGGAAGQPVETLAGIDDGGEERRLQITGQVDLPSDGFPHRFPVAAFTVPLKEALIVQAELVPAAILRSTQANAGTMPLLAGPVDLVRHGGYAGRGELLYVAPGASFDLGWGPDPEIRVIREVAREEEKRGMLESWYSTRHVITVHMVNLGRAPKSVRVMERIPVSEIDKVIIEVLKEETLPAVQPDAEGILTWQVELPPTGSAEIKLVWRMRRHPDVRAS